MADIDIDPFGEHESRPEEPTDEHIPLTPVGGRSTWEPEREQETSFRGRSSGRQSQRNRLLINWVEGLNQRLSQNWQEPQKYFSTTCLNSEMENCTSETKASP